MVSFPQLFIHLFIIHIFFKNIAHVTQRIDAENSQLHCDPCPAGTFSLTRKTDPQ